MPPDTQTRRDFSYAYPYRGSGELTSLPAQVGVGMEESSMRFGICYLSMFARWKDEKHDEILVFGASETHSDGEVKREVYPLQSITCEGGELTRWDRFCNWITGRKPDNPLEMVMRMGMYDREPAWLKEESP